MNFDPTNFYQLLYDLSPNTANKVQAWAAIGVLILTGFMTRYAKNALETWKDQEKHQTIVELIKYLSRSFEVVSELRSPFSGNISDIDRKIIEDSPSEFKRTIEKSMRITSKFADYDSDISNIRSLYLLSVSHLEVENPIREYYTFINDVMNNIKQRSKLYTYFSESADSTKGEVVENKKQLKELEQIGKEGFAKSEYGLLYIDYETALAEIAETLQHSKENWNITLSSIRSIEQEIFRPYVIDYRKDGTDQSIKRHYDNAVLYCKRYSNPKNTFNTKTIIKW